MGALSVNHKVTSVCTGKLSDGEKDYLAIGTEANLLVYQVDDNLEIFFKDIPEGVRSMVIGEIDNQSLLYVGSSTTVRGLNDKGEELLWIVNSSNYPINTIIIFDFNRDNDKKIVLGSEDKIKIYKKDKFLHELSENAPIKQLLGMGGMLGFILNNGTVGVYEEHLRLWRIKASFTQFPQDSYLNFLKIFSQKLLLHRLPVMIFWALVTLN